MQSPLLVGICNSDPWSMAISNRLFHSIRIINPNEQTGFKIYNPEAAKDKHVQLAPNRAVSNPVLFHNHLQIDFLLLLSENISYFCTIKFYNYYSI